MYNIIHNIFYSITSSHQVIHDARLTKRRKHNVVTVQEQNKYLT